MNRKVYNYNTKEISNPLPEDVYSKFFPDNQSKREYEILLGTGRKDISETEVFHKDVILYDENTIAVVFRSDEKLDATVSYSIPTGITGISRGSTKPLKEVGSFVILGNILLDPNLQKTSLRILTYAGNFAAYDAIKGIQSK